MHKNLIPAGLARVAEASAYLSISRPKLYLIMDAGELSYVKLGKSRRILWAELLKLVAQHTVPSQDEQGAENA